MKLVKLSLAAAILMGASAFAIDNVKVSGNAEFYYNTDNLDKAAGTNRDGLFGQENSIGDAALRVNVTGDIMKNLSFGIGGDVVSTLGLEDEVLSGAWANRDKTGNKIEDAVWIGELWMEGKVANTTAKVGRMELDTPFIFSEKWSVVPNTFTAALLTNTDIADTTLVGAWIGQGNGLNVGGKDNGSTAGWDYMANGGSFGTFASNGAYTVGAINNSFKPLVAQAWYFDVMDITDAYWLQADWDCQLLKDVKLGAQYASMDTKGALSSEKNSNAYAFKVAYEGIQNLKLSAAYSSVDKDGYFKIANVATDNNNRYSSKFDAQTKLYTEEWWNYGYVGAPGAKTVTLSTEYDAGIVKLYAQYTDVKVRPSATTNIDMNEATLTAFKSFGPLDVLLELISATSTDQNAGKRYETFQTLFTLHF